MGARARHSHFHEQPGCSSHPLWEENVSHAMGGLPVHASAFHPQPSWEAQRSSSVKPAQASVVPSQPVFEVVHAQPGVMRQVVLSLKSGHEAPPVHVVSPVFQVHPKWGVQSPSPRKPPQGTAWPRHAP